MYLLRLKIVIVINILFVNLIYKIEIKVEKFFEIFFLKRKLLSGRVQSGHVDMMTKDTNTKELSSSMYTVRAKLSRDSIRYD